jgi:hypothetical protein
MRREEYVSHTNFTMWLQSYGPLKLLLFGVVLGWPDWVAKTLFVLGAISERGLKRTPNLVARHEVHQFQDQSCTQFKKQVLRDNAT